MNDFDKDKYIYQSFWFNNEIKELYYAGNGFMQHSKNMGVEELFDLAVKMVEYKNAFMPTLVKKIEWLIGKENCYSDFWEFGDDDFSLYWFIKRDVYYEKMKLIQEWVEFEELEELVWFEETENTNNESTPKSKIPLNPLKGTLQNSLIFNGFPFWGQGV